MQYIECHVKTGELGKQPAFAGGAKLLPRQFRKVWFMLTGTCGLNISKKTHSEESKGVWKVQIARGEIFSSVRGEKKCQEGEKGSVNKHNVH